MSNVRRLTLELDGDPSLLNKKIQQAAKQPVDLKIDFGDTKGLLSQIEAIRKAAEGVGTTLSSAFNSNVKGALPMADAVNELHKNIASVITEIGTAENKLNSIRVTPTGEGFDQIRANIDGIKTAMDGISKVSLSALEPPDTVKAKLEQVRSEMQALSAEQQKMQSLEKYFSGSAVKGFVGRTENIPDAFYQKMQEYVKMGGMLSKIQNEKFGNLGNYLKYAQEQGFASTKGFKASDIIDNSSLSGAVAQIKQLRAEEEALVQTSGKLNLLSNVGAINQSIESISSLLHAKLGGEPIDLQLNAKIDDLKNQITQGLSATPVEVPVVAKQDANSGIFINMGNGVTVDKNAQFEQYAKGTALPDLRSQAKAYEDMLKEATGQRDTASAFFKAYSKLGGIGGKSAWDAMEATNKMMHDVYNPANNASLANQMYGFNEYIKSIQAIFSAANIDYSKVSSQFNQQPMDIINKAMDIKSGVAQQQTKEEQMEMLKSLGFGAKGIMPDPKDLGGFVENIQSGIEGQKVKVGFEPNKPDLTNFISAIETAVGVKVKNGTGATGTSSNTKQTGTTQTTKTKTEERRGVLQDKLNEEFKEKSFDSFGVFQNAKVNKNGSATLNFLKELENGTQKVTVEAKSAQAALDALKNGTFEKLDYQRGAVKENKPEKGVVTPEQKEDLKNYTNALVAQAKGLAPSAVQTQALENVRQEYEAIANSANNATASQEAFKSAVEAANMKAAQNLINGVQKDFQKLSAKDGQMLPGYSEKLQEMNGALEALQNKLIDTNGTVLDWNDDKQLADIQELLGKIEEMKTALKTDFNPASEASINALQQRMSSVERWNGKAFKSGQFAEPLNALKGNINSMAFGKTSDKQVADYNAQLSKLVANFQNAGKAGQSFGEIWRGRMTSLAAYLTTFASFYRIIRVIKDITNTVKTLNSAMIELEKVSDASAERLQQSFENSKSTAQELGATIDQVINATADWSRLGYSMDQAEELAKVAVIYQHVGDGIDIDTANESLISTLQGFKLEANEAMSVIDKFNEVANNTPIDSAGIGEALQRSAASFHAANTDLSESIALITGANAVVQDPSRVGNMWKTKFLLSYRTAMCVGNIFNCR